MIQTNILCLSYFSYYFHSRNGGRDGSGSVSIDFVYGGVEQLASSFPPEPVDNYLIGTSTFVALTLQYGLLTVLMGPAVSLVIYPVGSLTEITSADTGLRVLAQSLPPTVLNVPALSLLPDYITQTGCTLAFPSSHLVTVEILAVTHSITLPGTKVTPTVTFLVPAFPLRHDPVLPAVHCLVTFHWVCPTVPAPARTVEWVRAAGTVSHCLALRLV